MTTIFLVILFLMQIIGFYLLALLYTKVSKFDDLERKQQKLMQEMDDSIAAYLAEIKDENDKLIEQLTAQKDRLVQLDTKATGHAAEIDANPKEEIQTENPIPIPRTSTFQHAAKSYTAVKEQIEEEKSGDTDERERAIQMEAEGKSIEEIAKVLGKGKTEVELILKFK